MNDFSGVRALIIEDNASSIKVLSRLLDQLKAEVDVIDDTASVDDKLNAVERPDVVFIDLEMPGLNGYEVLETLLANPGYRGVPTVAYTTHISHLNEAKNAGFHSFMGKPVDGDRFPELLGRILQDIPVWEVPG